jgi:hypothetical protein
LIAHREEFSTALMGLAAVLTAWCAFEGAKRGGIQSIRFAQAGASRTESSRNDLLDHQLAQIDVASYLSWLQALGEEKRLEHLSASYRPDPNAVSGILFQRLRPDFQEAVRAWLATDPIQTTGAPRTPFMMEEYRRPLQKRANEQIQDADRNVQAGLDANRNSDNYTLLTVFSSLVIFFAGMSDKLRLAHNGLALFLLSCVTFVLCMAALAQLPVAI